MAETRLNIGALPGRKHKALSESAVEAAVVPLEGIADAIERRGTGGRNANDDARAILEAALPHIIVAYEEQLRERLLALAVEREERALRFDHPDDPTNLHPCRRESSRPSRGKDDPRNSRVHSEGGEDG